MAFNAMSCAVRSRAARPNPIADARWECHQARWMETVALIAIMASGLWLVAGAFLMAFQPRRFLHLLSLTASNWRVNSSEQGLRLMAGIALIIRADASKVPTLFIVSGEFIVASSVILLFVPLRWHAGYAIWWSHRLSLTSVRAIAPVSAALGALAIYAAI